MSFDRSLKDGSILKVLDDLERELTPRRLVVRDHWDADRFAVGVSSDVHPDRLVYVSTFKKPVGRYYFECEPVLEGRPIRRGNEVDLPALLDAVRSHLF